jgi:hypothetical protein
MTCLEAATFASHCHPILANRDPLLHRTFELNQPMGNSCQPSGGYRSWQKLIYIELAKEATNDERVLHRGAR